jgi:spermidine synthase
VLAIVIQPTNLKWVRGRDRALTGDMYFDPRVTLKLGEGRHVVRSADHSFDVIVIHAIDTYAAASSGAYALTENFLYTKEAFQDYYRALSDDGVLTFSRLMFYPPREDLRLFNTAVAVL